MKKISDKKETKSGKKKVIILSLVCLLILAVAGFFIFENVTKKDFRGRNFSPQFNNSERGGNFSLINDTTKIEITSFFKNSPSFSEIDQYCKDNPNYCIYYCREINKSDEYCTNFNFTNKNFSKGVPPQ